jgi:DEAD/DEAH box helicase domain-containing protein
MSLEGLLDRWRADGSVAPNIVAWQATPARAAVTHPFPDDLPAPLREALSRLGIPALYSHQFQTWQHARSGRNVALATGTASGKTLAYNLPVLAALLENPDARALYLFPTKALTQDQYSVISDQLSVIQALNTDDWSLNVGIYDGDTPARDRPAIRKNARLLLTNPDMLHTGVLPHHTNWADFFRNLRFIVIDELHTYRGVFGSHVANLIRRLKRVATFYGASPQFILTSATIGNPKELAEKLIEAPVTLVDEDGSARGERHFILYNPPIVDEALGLRASVLLESVRLAGEVLAAGVQGVVFARSRRGVEIMLTYLQEGREKGIESREQGGENSDYSPLSNLYSPVRGYRSGYLPSQRREIEKGLRDGSVRLVVATNALELGIDIGGLGAAILVGYPGTVASAWQQAGRAGRGDAPAAAVLVASSNPLDQFLARHPEYFFRRSPEQGLIDPDHLLILLEHLRCALFELPFQKGEQFGGQPVDEFLEFLAANREAHASNDKFYWMADQYPAANISLRSASPENVVIQTADPKPETIGEVDLSSALWMTHPGAVYMHQGQQYFVHNLDLERRVASVTAVALDYYTQAQRRTEIALLDELERAPAPGGEKGYGEIQVTSQVAGFKKLRWFTHENLGEEPLDLPPSDMQTTGYWLGLSEGTVSHLRQAGAWSNDPNDYGPDWPRIRDAARARDGYRCQACGAPETDRQHEVHHKTPFRAFLHQSPTSPRSPTSPDVGSPNQESLQSALARANRLDNLVTLCPACHRRAEQSVRIRSGLAGLGAVLRQLAPLYLMCDPGDLGLHIDPAGAVFGLPAVVLYDEAPGGIGFSQKLFALHDQLVGGALELVSACPCADGCPSCVGPGGENGSGGKQETLAILEELSIP